MRILILFVSIVIFCSCLLLTSSKEQVFSLAQTISNQTNKSIIDNNNNSITNTNDSNSSKHNSTNVATVTNVTTFVPLPPRRTKTKSRSVSKTEMCGLFSLYFGVPYFSSVNITLKQAVAHHIFSLPLFMTILAHYQGGTLVFDPDDFHTTYFVDDSEILTKAVHQVTGNNIVTISHLRRKKSTMGSSGGGPQWYRDLSATWVVRPPRDMLENVGVAIDLKDIAFFCGLTWSDRVPVGHILLARRYEQNQIFFVRGLLTLGDVVSFLTASSSICMIPHALQRAHILTFYFMCEIPDDLWYQTQFNPFQFELGAYDGARPRGALFGNILFMACFVCFMMVIAVGVTFWRRRREQKWEWKKCFEVPEPEIRYGALPLKNRIIAIAQDYFHFFCPAKSLTKVRWPGIMFIPFSFLMFGSSRAATELIRRALNFGDVLLALIAYAGIIYGFVCTWQIIRSVRRVCVSVVVSIPEKDEKAEGRFDRFCEYIRVKSFAFTTANAAYFSKKKKRFNRGQYKDFVEKYGSLFDGYHTMGYYWGLVEAFISFVLGILTSLHPRLHSINCAVTLMLIAVTFATYTLILFFVRPWSTMHNRVFSCIFALCNGAAISVALFGTYVSNSSYQKRSDSIDLATNGIALLKLFFDMVSLLLVPSLTGFFGYMFGSSGFRMMRQVAFEREQAKREEKRKLEEEIARLQREADEEEEEEEELFEEEEEEEQHEEEEEEEQHEEEEEEEEEKEQQQMLQRKPGVKYKIVRRFRVVKRKNITLPDEDQEEEEISSKKKKKKNKKKNDDDELKTPVGTPTQEPLLPPSAMNFSEDDEDGDENNRDDEDKEEEENSRMMRRKPPQSVTSSQKIIPPSPPASQSPGKQGLSSLDRYMMI